MLRLRPKLGSERGSEWRCCFCLHVRTGTIIFGVWHLLLHILALGILAMIMREPALLRRLQGEGGAWGGTATGMEQPPALPTPLSAIDQPAHPYTHTRDQSFVYQDIDMGALVTVCTMAITMMLIYGAVRGKPAHLLPFFCIQLFDFAITTLTATGYLCYLRSVHRIVTDFRNLPYRDELLTLSPAALSLLVLFGFLTAMIIKAYCINVVWRCYKYLTMRQHAMRSLMPYMMDGTRCSGRSLSTPRGFPQPSPPAPLPDYEEALKQAPPPSYQAATAHLATEANSTPASASLPPTAAVTPPVAAPVPAPAPSTVQAV